MRKAGVEEGSHIAFGNDANDITLFQHARHAVMIGHHPDLAPFASESITAEDETALATKIVEKILELARPAQVGE